jgi:hypothetical protein
VNIVSKLGQDSHHTELNGFMGPIQDAFTVEGGLLEGTPNYKPVFNPVQRPIALDVAGEGRMPTEDRQYQEHSIHAAPNPQGVPAERIGNSVGSPVKLRTPGEDSTLRQIFFWANQLGQAPGTGQQVPTTVPSAPSTSQTQRSYLQ